MCILLQPVWAGTTALWHVVWRGGEQPYDRLKAQQQEVKAFFDLLSNVAYQYEDEGDGLTIIPLAAYENYVPSGVIPVNYVSHRWIDLNSDGVQELLLIDDPSGRGFFQLNLILQHPAGYSWQALNMERGNQYIAEPIQDIDGDGAWEILLEQRVGRYRGDEEPVVELVILGFDGTRYVDMTSKYPDYHKQWEERFHGRGLKD